MLQGVADICEVCQVYPKSLAAGRMALYPQQLQRGKATCIEPDNHRQFEATIFCPDVLGLPLAAMETNPSLV